MRVLIADDDRDLVEALAEYVRECGHEVCATVTGGGLAVIQSFARYLPDVVILDVMMPRYNGITACHALLSRKPDTKVIFMSGKVQSDHPFVMSCGAVAYLHKPILMEDVQEVLGAVSNETLIPLARSSVAA